MSLRLDTPLNTKNSCSADDMISLLLVLITFLISMIGCALLYSAAGGNLQPWALKQFIMLMIFGIVAFLSSFVSIKFFYSNAYYIYFISFILLITAHISGYNAMGAQRWLRIGFLNIQPSELMKIALIIVIAHHFQSIHFSRTLGIKAVLLPLLLVLMPAYVIIKQPNLGTAVLIVLLTACMFFTVGVRLSLFGVLGGFACAGVPLAWVYLLHNYQKLRIEAFLNPETDVLGSGYNIMQSKIAIGSGFLFGKGILSGTQSQLSFLPEKHTDFIFSILAEELGFTGVIFVLVLYFCLIMLCYLIALRSSNQYGRIISIGVGSMIFLHVFTNVAMVSGMLPATGIPLPLVSYGGSNLSITLLGIGFVLNAHKHTSVIIKH